MLQALDAAGKDGTIRHVMSGVNPQGVSVHCFKAPSAEELDHDYLWRFATNLPARGEIGIFNRSYYEEVLVVRVHPEILQRRAAAPAGAGHGTSGRSATATSTTGSATSPTSGFTIVKLFLNLSKEEQRVRFLAPHRPARPQLEVLGRRRQASASYWDDYQKAFSEMLSNTSTEWAPWYVIPADHKWFARAAPRRSSRTRSSRSTRSSPR